MSYDTNDAYDDIHELQAPEDNDGDHFGMEQVENNDFAHDDDYEGMPIDDDTPIFFPDEYDD